MEILLPLPKMPDVRFRTGGSYTVSELAELARRGLAEKGLTQAQAIDYLNQHYKPERGQYHRTQISAALNNPTTNPGMVLLLVEAFTDYQVKEEPRYRLDKK